MSGWTSTRLSVATGLGVLVVSLVGWGATQAAAEPSRTLSVASQAVVAEVGEAGQCESSTTAPVAGDEAAPAAGGTSNPSSGTSSFGPQASAAGAAVVQVDRFWSPGFANAHFFTADEAEKNSIIATDRNWRHEGRAFAAYDLGTGCGAGTTAVYRFYSVPFRSHFFTVNVAEKDAIVAADRNWSYEGVAYCAPATGTAGSTPLHRFWSPVFGKHFYTANTAEKDMIVATDRNWVYEGEAYSVLP